MKAKEYRDAVNSGKMKAPKETTRMIAFRLWASKWGNTPGAYRAYMNGGEK